MDSRKLFNIGLKTFLFLSPIFFFRGYKLSFARGMFFVLGSFALFAISLGCEAKRRFSNIWLSLFLLLAFVPVFFDNLNPNAEWFNFWMNCANFIYVFCGVLIFYIVYTYADNLKEYLKPIVWVCIANFILTVSQMLKFDFMWNNSPSLCGFMENSSQLGQYSALALPVVLFVHPFLSIFPLFTLIVSKSISPILAGAIGMAVFGVLRGYSKVLIGLIGVCLIIAGLTNLGYLKAKFQCRPVIWQKTLKSALQKPYLGHGYGSFQEEVNKIKGEGLGGVEYLRPHNDYLHTAQELGFIILIPIGMFFLSLYKKFILIKQKEKLVLCLGTSILTVLINMSGQSEIRYASIAGTFIVLLALFCIKVEDVNG